MKISFVIPCYRSEKTIEGVVAEIKSVVGQRPDVGYLKDGMNFFPADLPRPSASFGGLLRKEACWPCFATL